MGVVKNLKGMIILNGILILFFSIGALLKNLSVAGICIFVLIEILIIGGLYFCVAKPLSNFEKALNSNLEDISDDTIFIEKIKTLVEKNSNQRIRENSAEMFYKQAELAAFQSQINPHFLYNTLESIRGQALIDDNIEIAKMVEALADFFRYSISRKDNLVTLRDELANIQNYMMILRYRFNNRFSLDIYIDEEDKKAYDYFIPKLILQPIVENAIFHGLEECLEGGKVDIEVIVTDNSLILTISDNGKGMDSKSLLELNERIRMSKEYPDDSKGFKQRNTGIALPNINKRIQLLFGEEYGIYVYSTLNQGTDIEITIPANYERSIR